MICRLRLVFLSALFCTHAIYSQTENSENFVIKPGQSVYILAVKGECGSGINPATIFRVPGGIVGER